MGEKLKPRNIQGLLSFNNIINRGNQEETYLESLVIKEACVTYVINGEKDI